MEEHKNNYAVYGKHVAFWSSAFSNFYRCKFIYKGLVWHSSEQAYMAEKAIYFGDYASFLKILEAATPADAKALGRKVKNFDSEEWDSVSFDYMYDIVYEKFHQNKDLKAMLLDKSLRGKGFVEGSPEDAIWGVKIIWSDPKIDNENAWRGENRLGKVLDKVREDMLNKNFF